MKKENYISTIKYLNEHNSLVSLINIANKAITYFVVALYVIYDLYLAIQGFATGDFQKFLITSMVPGIPFVLLSVYRSHNHSKRPYELYGFTPIIEKDTVEKSFPSRHVFSIFIIAMVFVTDCPILTCILGVMGVLLAIIRVVSGVHFVKDVVAGAIIAIICGILGFVVIPF